MPQRPCLVLTRPKPESERFAQQARDIGWQEEILIAPLLEIVLLSLEEADFASARTLIVTSQHAVSALALATDRRDWPVWAVGPRTAQAALEAGFAAVHQSGGDAKALLADLAQAPLLGPILHIRGRHAIADIAAALQAFGHDASSVVGYEQFSRSFDDSVAQRVQRGGDVVLPVFSPRSGRLLGEALQTIDTSKARVHLIGISAAALQAVSFEQAASCHIAARPDAASMCAKLYDVQQTLEPAQKPR
ncbi:uroporphyrinogen-III synthase [Roseinatronobacter bogoriensis]|uniref:Uroporphyrinogen-III synthase n=1 Tax=Roseinatronobacter bogoriensis subsp. barguzinensis TaxID=441209 RepID=A0A2K8KAN3_9RHOB|nr:MULTISPECIES: uroporphyrinogen-III synthase [Rhodobaca]ATX66497.1 uroporphyrinogen-III synthase [Rhodobaca barguzinensis]MBB4207657.1 uroporphyrinogen-III synthase [Rhodobaca bogoriensis DSM 18756]TDW40036.1 uroporphyrinogen-III synthase [Rhodobaca barguzinensis]TDY70811.1 uroporphyrinogen-III synthase [Rhodobaca bogoriensis DSM 18756]